MEGKSGWGSSDSEQDLAVQPGITVKFNKIKDIEQEQRLFSFIDSLLSVSLMEKQANIRNLISMIGDKNEIGYYSNPNEQFCKENLSFFDKYLTSLKMGEGIDFTMKNFGIKETTK